MIALAGCSSCNPVARCSEDVGCGTGAHCVDTYCVLDGTGPGGGGGTGDGGTGDGGMGGCNISQLAWMTPPSSTLTTTKDAGIALELGVVVGINCTLADFPPVTVTASQGATNMLMPTVVATAPNRYLGSVNLPVDGTWSLIAKFLDGGQATTSVNVDSKPPRLELELPAIADCPDAGLDCNDAVFANTAWRRNQALQLKVKGSESLIAPSMRLYSINADGGYATFPREACTTFCDAGDCACFTVELWKPMMNAYRGSMKIEVTATDMAGNVSDVDGGIKVTRFNWSRTISDNGEVKATPAIGWDGTIYVGSKGTTDGKLFGISPSGLEKFALAVGMVEASPTVSPPDAGAEIIYVGANNSGGTSKIYAVRPAGTEIVSCPGSAPITGSPVVSHSLAVFGGLVSTNAIFQIGKVSLAEIRPQSMLSICRDFGNDAEVPFPGNLTYGSGLVTAGDTKPQLRGYDVHQVLTFVERTNNNWAPGNLGFGTSGQVSALSSATQLVGARFSGNLPNTLYRATMGAAFTVDEAINVVTNPTGPAVGPTNDVWLGHEAQLEVYARDAGVSMSLPAVLGTYATTPLLGEGQRLFALVNANGGNPQIQSLLRTSPAISEWTGELSTTAISFLASPTIDCTRDMNGLKLRGRPGVLYAVSNTRTLYSVIVDSRGIDTTAQWPKYQRDPRNSGSADTQLAEFDCR